MTTAYNKETLAALLAPWKQEHLLNFWDELTDEQKDILGAQIIGINWEQVTKWFRNVTSEDADSQAVPFDKLIPAPYVALEAASQDDKAMQKKARELGEELLRSGKVAGFTVAGGQGTRLGFDGPKGTYCFSEIRNASLFQCFAEALLCNQKKYGTVIPWYIMTSPANHADTVAFFEANTYFGLEKANVRFFTQGTLPGFP